MFIAGGDGNCPSSLCPVRLASDRFFLISSTGGDRSLHQGAFGSCYSDFVARGDRRKLYCDFNQGFYLWIDSSILQLQLDCFSVWKGQHACMVYKFVSRLRLLWRSTRPSLPLASRFADLYIASSSCHMRGSRHICGAGRSVPSRRMEPTPAADRRRRGEAQCSSRAKTTAADVA